MSDGEKFTDDTVVQPVFRQLRSIAIQDGHLSVCGQFEFTPVREGTVQPPDGFEVIEKEHEGDTLFLLIGTRTLTCDDAITYRFDTEAAVKARQEAEESA